MRMPSPDPAQPGAASLAADFTRLEAKLHAVIGIAVSAVGSRAAPIAWGHWQSGSAWSTIKVPLAIAALREEDPPKVTPAMISAVTKSDNAAAESLWQSLGNPVNAAHKVEAVLKETGDATAVQSHKVRPEFSAFGQTHWSLIDQTRFASIALCDSRNAPIFALMGRITCDQRWGIGTVPGARFKGGWGPSVPGGYLVRQIGVLSTPTGLTAVALAAQPASGSFADGIQDLTEMGRWLAAHSAALPSGQCGR
jgi:hypothetical protein